MSTGEYHFFVILVTGVGGRRSLLTAGSTCSKRARMTALAFDTHKAVTALKQAGFEEGQAEAVVTTVGDALGGNVATKADLTEVRAALEADMAALKADLTADMAALRTDLTADMAALKAGLETDIAVVRTEMAQAFQALYKQLWLMAVGIVGLTVTLVKLIL